MRALEKAMRSTAGVIAGMFVMLAAGFVLSTLVMLR